MAKINLKNYYPFYQQDCYIEVSDELADMLSAAERAEDGRKCISDVHLRELRRSRAHCLEDYRYRAARRVGVADGEGDALAELLVDHEDDELAGLALLCDERGLELHAEDVIRELFLADYAIHKPHIIPYSARVCARTEKSNFRTCP